MTGIPGFEMVPPLFLEVKLEHLILEKKRVIIKGIMFADKIKIYCCKFIQGVIFLLRYLVILVYDTGLII